jgi:hypothetical protein
VCLSARALWHAHAPQEYHVDGRLLRTGAANLSASGLKRQDNDLIAILHEMALSHALSLALAVAKQNNSELHMVSVEEIDYMPEFIEELREETGTAAPRFHGVMQRARAMAEGSHVKLHIHVVPGHPVRDIVKLAADFNVDLLDRPFGIVRADGREPRGSHHATRKVSGARREVTRRTAGASRRARRQSF